MATPKTRRAPATAPASWTWLLETLRPQLLAALQEDLGSGDITTAALIPSGRRARARVVAKAPLVLAGLAVAAEVFRLADPSLQWKSLASEGDTLEAGSPIARIQGSARGILGAERVALNFLQHLSGIATLTRRFVEAVRGTGVQILDTRKTLPGLRWLEKHAVRVGGGRNHRMGLSDGILIKDNHIALAGGVARAVRAARSAAPHTLRIQVEVQSLAEVRAALEAGADALLLDNMSPELLRKAVALARGRAFLEASGNVTLDRVREVAETGVDAISVGALTHSAPAADIALEMEKS